MRSLNSLRDKIFDHLITSIKDSIDLYSRQIEVIDDNSYRCRKEIINNPYQGESDAINNFMVQRITDLETNLERVIGYKGQSLDNSICEISSLVKAEVNENEVIYLIVEESFNSVTVEGFEVIPVTLDSPVGGELFKKEVGYEFSYGNFDYYILEIG